MASQEDREMKLCPLLLTGQTMENSCKEDRCAWWESNLGMCGMVVESFLVARATVHQEIQAEREIAKSLREKYGDSS